VGIAGKRVVFACLLALGVAIYLPPVLPMLASFLDGELSTELVDRDFVNYWMASHLVLSGQLPDLFAADTYQAQLVGQFGPQDQDRAWSYPPHYLLAMLPLSLLPYEAAAAAFLGATFALFAAATLAFRRAEAPGADLLPVWAAVAAYALVNVNALQNGFLIGALLLFGLAFRGRRPVLAGLAFGLLTVKPQLGLLVPLLLLFERDWATILWSGVFTAALVALSAAVFGTWTWESYIFQTAEEQRNVLTDWTGIFIYMMPTVFASARTLGLDTSVAFLLQWPVSLAALVAALWLFRPRRFAPRPQLRAAMRDLPRLPLRIRLRHGGAGRRRGPLAGAGTGWAGLAALTAVAFLPVFVLLLSLLGAPVAPVVLALALAARIRDVARGEGRIASGRTNMEYG
jgi:hypothetical protein